MFKTGGLAYREGDSSRIFSKQEADDFSRQISAPKLGQIYCIDEPCFRIPHPEYDEFTERTQPCNAVLTALKDPRTSITSIVGSGGMGKTALATWAVLKAFDEKQFEFIV